MRFWKSKKEFAALVPKPTAGTISLYRGQYLEGEYFAKFSFLEEVAETDVDIAKVIFSQTGLNKLSKGVFLESVVAETVVSPTPEAEPESAVAVKEEEEDKPSQIVKKRTNRK